MGKVKKMPLLYVIDRFHLYGCIQETIYDGYKGKNKKIKKMQILLDNLIKDVPTKDKLTSYPQLIRLTIESEIPILKGVNESLIGFLKYRENVEAEKEFYYQTFIELLCSVQKEYVNNKIETATEIFRLASACALIKRAGITWCYEEPITSFPEELQCWCTGLARICSIHQEL
jgi:hypothetical protein